MSATTPAVRAGRVGAAEYRDRAAKPGKELLGILEMNQFEVRGETGWTGLRTLPGQWVFHSLNPSKLVQK